MTQKDHYSPGEIRFKVVEALWLIQNLDSLQVGHWPPDASNYTDIIGRTSRRHKAPFETAVEFYAEITARLEKCGQDGLILEALEAWGKSEESMSKYLKMPVWSIHKRAKQALSYVASGPARRWHNIPKREGEDYQAFKKRRRIEKVSIK